MIKVKVETIEIDSVKIYRMSTLNLKEKPILWVSSYFIDGLLIDFGHYHAKDDFLKALDLNEIELCVLSHHHEDHLGACYDLINNLNLPIYATKETAFFVRPKIRIPPERNLVWGLPKPIKASLLPNYEYIKTNKAEFKIIPSPGHCNNLISFFQVKKRYLFSTDALISEEQNVIFNWENAIKMLNTYNKFKDLNPKYIFLEDGRVLTIKDLEHLINYWSDLKNQSETLYKEGFKPKEIVKKIFGKESWLKISTGGDMSRENLIRSLLELAPIFKRKIRN
jgi:glyoxylase-like metal-dependent hydrolase (beta-lactamase superfamily II)